MFSTSALLIMLLFAIRKRKKGDPNLRTASATTDSSESTNADMNVGPPVENIPNRKEDFNLDELLAVEPKKEELSDIVEMVNRYRFFQGKNLETFERLVSEKNTQGIETLIREKFECQGKENAGILAGEVTKKLMQSMEPA